MAGAPVRIVTLPDGTRQRLPSGEIADYINNTFLPNQSFQNSATAAIPGLTAPRGAGAGIPGLLEPTPTAPPNPIIPSPQQQPTQFQASGPYGMQAMQMAGLLGSAGMSGMSTPMGLLGKGYRVPGIK